MNEPLEGLDRQYQQQQQQYNPPGKLLQLILVFRSFFIFKLSIEVAEDNYDNGDGNDCLVGGDGDDHDEFLHNEHNVQKPSIIYTGSIMIHKVRY